jgi:hypothetical protein
MSRSKYHYGLACLLLVGAALGCDGGDPVGSSDPALLDSDEFALVDFEDAIANVGDATLAGPMMMGSVFHDGRFGRHAMHPGGPGSHLGPILHQLDLTSDQISDIRVFMQAFRESIAEPLEGLRDANVHIIAAANEERQAIRDAFNAGEIPRDEAFRLLILLSQETREEIRNNPANEPFRQAICDARLQLLDAVRAVLDDLQQPIWDDWVARFGANCS